MKTINLEIQVPDWVEWIAQDDSGAWTGFSARPEYKKDERWWKLDEGSEVTLTIGRFVFYENSEQSLRKV